MFLHNLKINITLHLAFLIALAMILINMVMMTAFQGILVRSRVNTSALLSTVMEHHIGNALYEDTDSLPHKAKNDIRNILQKEDLACAVILNKNKQPLLTYQYPCEKSELLDHLVLEAMAKQQRLIRFSNKTWSLFWNKEEYLVIAQPVFRNLQVVGGTGMVLHLEGIHSTLRKIQHLFWSYFGINLVVLTIIGLYQFSKMMIKPLQRILNRAEDYEGEGEIVFGHEDKNNEYNRLSSALNRMFMGISKDKETLNHTIGSLENANQDLKQAQKELIRAEKLASVGRLSSGIAHEIGNPIGIVLGYLDLLKRDDISTAEKKDFINRAEDEINRINTVVRQLLDFSKPSQEEAKALSVNELLDDLAEVVKPQSFMGNIDLTVNTTAQKDTVIANPDGLRQVFFNLLINATDAVSVPSGDARGNIDILTENIFHFDAQLKKNVPAVKITVSDNGHGILPENMEFIFDPFFTTKEPGKGTGLGLSVSYMIVENMGGHIEAQNCENHGAAISVILPLAPEREEK